MNDNDLVRSEIWAAVEGLTDEQLNKRIEAGKWTIMQVLEHLYKTEKEITKGIVIALNKEDEPTDKKPYHLTLDPSRKLDTPPHLIPADAFIPLANMKSRLLESRNGLNAAAAGASPELIRSKSFPHRIFGVMDVEQWIEVVGIHEKRHLGQIEDLIKGLTAAL